MNRTHHLTDRQAAVLRLWTNGLIPKQIAGELSVSSKTVEDHLQAVKRKLGLRDKALLTKWAIQHRVTGRGFKAK